MDWRTIHPEAFTNEVDIAVTGPMANTASICPPPMPTTLAGFGPCMLTSLSTSRKPDPG